MLVQINYVIPVISINFYSRESSKNMITESNINMIPVSVMGCLGEKHEGGRDQTNRVF